MYAITGITGKVGGALAEELLAAGKAVRAVVRDRSKAAIWVERGCEVAVSNMEDAGSLASAFAGAEAVFILPPSEFDPKPGYPEARRVIDAVVAALAASRPAKVVCLSTIGADAPHDNLLTQRTLMEAAFSVLFMPVTFLRPGWFIENAQWDLVSARDEGVIRSLLFPLDKRFPMVSTQDVGRAAARLMQEEWSGTRIVELEGPSRVSPNDLATAFAQALGRDVYAEAIAREQWEALFRAQGSENPEPRIRMLDGFNEGWIEFAAAGAHALKGGIGLQQAIDEIVRN